MPLLRVKSQYTLTGKVGGEMLRGNGLFIGNFSKKIIVQITAKFHVKLKKNRNNNNTLPLC